MKSHIALLASLPLLLSMTAVAAAQSTEPPPVKMGLWQYETTTTADANSAPSPMARALGDHTTITQSCFTPESWRKGMQDFHSRQQRPDCTQSNLQQDSHHISVDEKCAGDRGYTTDVHFMVTFDDPEHAHGDGAMKMSGPAFPGGMAMHMNMKYKFLSSDCGDVKPGEGKVIH